MLIITIFFFIQCAAPYVIQTPYSINIIHIGKKCSQNSSSCIEFNTKNWFIPPIIEHVACIKSLPKVAEFSNKHNYRFIVFGDSGATNLSTCPGSESVYKAIKNLNDIDLVVHVGDISYADGDPLVWFQLIKDFDKMIENGKIPIAITLGNHEYDYLLKDAKITHDPTYVYNDYLNATAMPTFSSNGPSNGECGVSYTSFFHFNTQVDSFFSNRNFWYEFEMGFIKFYVLSSEHDLSSQSVQGRFIRNAVLNSKKYS